MGLRFSLLLIHLIPLYSFGIPKYDPTISFDITPLIEHNTTQLIHEGYRTQKHLLPPPDHPKPIQALFEGVVKNTVHNSTLFLRTAPKMPLHSNGQINAYFQGSSLGFLSGMIIVLPCNQRLDPLKTPLNNNNMKDFTTQTQQFLLQHYNTLYSTPNTLKKLPLNFVMFLENYPQYREQVRYFETLPLLYVLDYTLRYHARLSPSPQSLFTSEYRKALFDYLKSFMQISYITSDYIHRSPLSICMP